MKLPNIFRPSSIKIAVAISLLFSLLVLAVSGNDRLSSARFLGGSYMRMARFFRTFELRAFDQKFFARGPVKPPYNVAIAAIDERSVATYGRWPWPRTRIAELIRKLNEKGAKVIALDLVFSEPDQLGTYGLLGDILKRLDQVPKLDPQLAAVKAELISLQGQWQLLAKSKNLGSTEQERILHLYKLQGKAVDRLLDELNKQRQREDALREFEKFLREERERVNADRILGETVEKAGNVVLGYFFLNADEIVGLGKDQYWDFSTLETSKISVLGGKVQDEASAKATLARREFRGVRPNIPAIAGKASTQGFFNVGADLDSIYRRAPLLVSLNNEIYPSLNLQAVQQYLKGEGTGIIVPVFQSDDLGLSHITMNTPHLIEANWQGEVFYNWYGFKGTIPTFSIVDILEDKVPREQIENRILFVGPTALAIADLRSTPFSEDYPGVEMQATIAANILQNNYLKRTPGVFAGEVLFTLFGGIGLGFLLRRRRPVTGFLLTVAILGGLFLLDTFFLFLQMNIWVRSFWPLVGLFFVYLGVTLYGFITEELSKRQLKKTFDVYVSPSVVDQMLSSPDKFRLGGERKELTVFFCDIRSFTSISERFEPEDLVHFLNEYFTPMTEIVLRYDGTLDKFIGDAIMGFWGAPLPQPDHAERACHAALDMMAKLAELRVQWKKRDLPPLDIGFGMNSGPMAVGNMGSKSRFSYTVMGDGVNLASRLEGLCKEYGVQIVIGAATARLIEKNFIVRPLDRVRVKGRAGGEEVYELMARRNGVSPETQAHEERLLEIAKVYGQGLELFWSRKWAEAQSCFEKVLVLRENDQPSRLFLEQIAVFRESPPLSGWDGVRTMTTK